MRAFVLNNIKQGYPQLVAVSAGQLVGWCDVVPKPRPIYAHVGVLGMGLLPEFRGQGLGDRLIRQTLAAARALGLNRVELSVRENNAGAIALYKRVGFEIEGLQRNATQSRWRLRKRGPDGYSVLGATTLTAACHTPPPAHSG